MTEKDWKKEAYQMHTAFHQTALQPLDTTISDIYSSEETKSKLQEISSQIHSMFDTLIMWVEKLSDEKLKLEGQLEEARAVRDRRYLKRPSES